MKIYLFFGNEYNYGDCLLPEIADYWTHEAIFQTPWFPSVMSRNKVLMSCFLHFADNSKAPSRSDADFIIL